MAWIIVIICIVIVIIAAQCIKRQSEKEAEKVKKQQEAAERQRILNLKNKRRNIYRQNLNRVYDLENIQTLLKAREYLLTIDGIDLPINKPAGMDMQDYRELRNMKFEANDNLKALLKKPYWTINSKTWDKICYYPDLDIKYINQLLKKKGIM